MACKLGSLKTVTYTVENWVSIREGKNQVFNAPDKNGITPFHLACKYASPKVVKYLLDNNHAKKLDIKVNQADKSGMTPLHIACDQNNYEIVTLLIAAKANKNAKKKEKTVMQFLNPKNKPIDFCDKNNADGKKIIALLSRN